MKDVLIVDNISKIYYSHKSEIRRVLSWFNLVEKPKEKKEVLKNVSFCISPGETVGIVGSNGAGKSSLLKIIANTLCQTSGSVVLNGSVSAILELGMGFHPELSGRQNAINTVKLMGYSIDEGSTVLSDIESFSDIGEYFDLPVRSYSSGMQVRVAFAVATAFRPDLLIIDEALSVGDGFFQRKCFDKIEEFQKKGTAILLVSHDMETIKRICSKAALIKNGRLIDFGEVKKICSLYERSSLSEQTNNDIGKNISNKVLYESDGAKIISCWVESSNHKSVSTTQAGEVNYFCYEVIALKDIYSPVFNMQIKTKEGLTLNGVNSLFLKNKTQVIKSGNRVQVKFYFQTFFAPGDYYFSCGIKDKNGEKFLHRSLDCFILKVIQKNKPSVAVGLVDLNSKIFIEVFEK